MDDTEKNGINQQIPEGLSGSIRAEEVSSDIERPEEIAGSIPPESTPDVPVYQEHGNKWVLIASIIVFFLITFGLIYWFVLRNVQTNNTSPDVSVPTGEVTLKYWGLWEEKEVMLPLIGEYQTKNPKVTIEYEKMSPDQYRERLIARSQTGNGPDIFRFHNTWIPELQDVISPLPSDLMSVEEFSNTFYPIHKRDLIIKDQIYGIPLEVDGTVLIYNDALLKQAGLVGPPTSWLGSGNDVFSTLQKVTVKDANGNIITAGMGIGSAKNVEHFGELFSILLLLNGGDFKNLNTPEAAEALELYRKAAEDGFWDDSLPNSVAAFTQGQVAMILAPSWQVLSIKAQNPDLVIGVAPVPAGLDGSAVSIASYWAEGVNKLSPNQAEAWKFLTFLAQKEQQIVRYENQAKVRPFGTAYARVDLAELQKDNPYLSPVLSQAKDDVYVSLPVASRTFDAGLNDEILTYIEDAISSTAQGTSYTSALSTAQLGISKVYERFQLPE